MSNYIKKLLLFTALTILSMNLILAGELNIGSAIFNRYVWRGTDFGNSAAIQPYLSYTKGPLEIGAWSSWSINGAAGGNENDLYISYSYKSFSFTLTDYFFPGYTGDDLIDKLGKNGGHTFEASAGADFAGFSVLAAVNAAGNDPNNSKYIELGYNILSKNNLNSSIFLGAGDYIYSVDNSFTIVNVGISVSKDILTGAYIINPDQKTSFLTFSISL